ncbi:hypothetical protein SAY87_010451 [Trapa incisa]|uniref:Uncharacterized protein n=1 Tax=Trapa incisa TaxID=236973 RepID=A0AAN7GLJ3_9MYRT|nr:hypothetical protein SAY87_010451 [Trapa incisa]
MLSGIWGECDFELRISPECDHLDSSRTDHCNEAFEKLDTKYDIVVNMQDDEPLIERLK